MVDFDLLQTVSVIRMCVGRCALPGERDIVSPSKLSVGRKIANRLKIYDFLSNLKSNIT